MVATPEREIVIDEDLDKRLARDLKERGRKAVSCDEAGTRHLLDEPMLDKLAQRADPWVLVTGDDHMPEEHAAKVAEVGATIATVDGDVEGWNQSHGKALTQDQFRKETVQRWAHVIARQGPGEIRRYNPTTSAVWKPKVRKVRHGGG